MEHLNTEGVVKVGEVETRVLKEARAEFDLGPAIAHAKTEAYEEMAVWIRLRLASCGPYDDTRSLMGLLTWLADRIREVNTTTSEVPNG